MDGQGTVKLPEAARTVGEWVADGTTQGLLVRRRYLRYVWPGAVDLLINRGTPAEKRIFGTGRDVSGAGMGLVVRQELPVGTDVVVRYAADGDRCPWVPARVVHSTPVDGGYRVGIEFQLSATE